MRHPTFRVLATLLGLLSAVSAAATVVFAALWILDQGPTAGMGNFLTAIGLGIVAMGCMVGRRMLLIAAGR